MSGYEFGPIGLFLFVALAAMRSRLPFRWEHGIGVYGLALFLYGQYGGLVIAPPERMMGDVARILYVHVPAAWMTMVMFTWAFVGALGALLWRSKRDWFDHLSEAATEVGVVLGCLLLVLGAIFARPTWGVYWTWDPRLTASAIMVLSFVGVILLRALVAERDVRVLWASTATILAFVNIPITYMAVRWWRSMHQLQSSPDTMSDLYVFFLRVNAWAFLALATWFVVRRWRIAHAQALLDAPPELPPAPSPAAAGGAA